MPDASPKGVPFSESIVWTWQKDFFQKMGIKAWSGSYVPVWATNNPFLASTYVDLIEAYVDDLTAANALQPEAPIYILDLGAGCGRLAYQLLRQLEARPKKGPLAQVRFCYVLCDVIESLHDFWLTHPQLVPYFEDGRLDLATFDTSRMSGENPAHFQLQRQGTTLAPESLTNPIIALANYFFDSLPCDLLHVVDGEVRQKLVHASVPESHSAKPWQHLDALIYDQHERALEPSDWDNEATKYALDALAAETPNAHLYFPRGGLRALSWLWALSGGRCMLLSTDKAITSATEAASEPFTMPVVHGSLSFLVDYRALRHYTEALGGRGLFQPTASGQLHLAALMSDEALPNFEAAFAALHQSFGPREYVDLLGAFQHPAAGNLSLEATRALLALGGFDPNIFLFASEIIAEKLWGARSAIQEGWPALVQRIEENYFRLPEKTDYDFGFGLVWLVLGDATAAQPYLERSLREGTQRYRSALCLSWLATQRHEIHKAKTYRDAAEAEGPVSHQDHAWRARLT